VCIDGYAKRLIVDPGSLQYPRDFFGPERYQYYNAAARGHNVPVFGGREMRPGEGHAATVVDMRFDDRLGAAWAVDTTALYGGVDRVRRAVIHLLPGVVAVLDVCDLRCAEATSIRWHTADRAEPDAEGAFVVENDGVSLAGRLVSLGREPVVFSRGEHEYRPPFHRDRLDNPLEQKRESFVEVLLREPEVRVLSLFSVVAPGRPVPSWQGAGRTCRIPVDGGDVSVEVVDEALCVHGPAGELRVDAGRV
jgi:hypothetical protein